MTPSGETESLRVRVERRSPTGATSSEPDEILVQGAPAKEEIGGVGLGDTSGRFRRSFDELVRKEELRIVFISLDVVVRRQDGRRDQDEEESP